MGKTNREYGQLLDLPDSRVMGSDGIINAALSTSVLFDRTGHVTQIYVDYMPFPT